MKIKVCGIKYPEQLKDLQSLAPDYLGFIFAKKSPRFLTLNEEAVDLIRNVKFNKVGVFVNASINEIEEYAEKLDLQFIQLHGDETQQMIDLLQKKHKVIKVFKVDEEFDFSTCQEYQSDLFLFDTKGKLDGGNGTKFNWNLLEKYDLPTPFLLSGGISLKDLTAINGIEHPGLHGIDINSGFEIRPGLKNIALVGAALSHN